MYEIEFFIWDNNFTVRNVVNLQAAKDICVAVLSGIGMQFELCNNGIQYGPPGTYVGDPVYATIRGQSD